MRVLTRFVLILFNDCCFDWIHFNILCLVMILFFLCIFLWSVFCVCVCGPSINLLFIGSVKQLFLHIFQCFFLSGLCYVSLCLLFLYHSFDHRIFETAFFLYFKAPNNVFVLAFSSVMVHFLRLFRGHRDAGWLIIVFLLSIIFTFLLFIILLVIFFLYMSYFMSLILLDNFNEHDLF